ncbi:SMP-30/gluconolactonase/LRE family protein [Shimia abyssi]|uniref:Sugar lactone lactonase YvrE n=1 Tax=Shimia abyssi TaxID=1662395 RepID=A0A2P8FAU7_9RHOB|nr:SMP-30/gluconolactonase/LRE family protein [Shimia abyssi]PSL18829.1 sugar lactone lactonase YvrE [Shimia abyssi]
MSEVFDNRVCALGEGPLWHPERKQLFWFDILSKQLLTREGDAQKSWQFDEHVSAAGWVDQTTLIMASETGLWRFDLETGTRKLLVALEADNPVTRSNDGRADPQGGFWIGTMGKSAEAGAGAIYRYYRGGLRKLVADVTISNAICFAPDGASAFYTDTVTKQIMRWTLDTETGWPTGEAGVFLDLTEDGLNPDGAVVDASGLLWVAQWGAARVAAYDGDGAFVRTVSFEGQHTSCPAFGGVDLSTLFCTTARDGVSDNMIAEQPSNGMTFACPGVAQGQREHRVIL